ncbi:RING-H2 finger protein ATL72-like [Phragmites australis]|uniref:RING-H2 finger protein ATL72-like n=1 Tax=Phragmites australis TaxID=29695 RepID=UPI002D777537|nr:RING-H2 finger protein ATL72-like [Phragmites australis]
MLNPHRRPPPPSPRVDDGYLACYGIVVACVSLLLLTILAATVNIVKACALAGAVAVVFGAFGCVARWCADDGAAPALSTTVTPAARASATCGMVDAAINALPAFAYARPGTVGSEGGSSSKPSRHRLCAVCLEEIESGEMVRQLPACRHLFHVECIDMWLHSHSTCPLCRCDVSPQQVDVKPTAAAAPDDTLPPV